MISRCARSLFLTISLVVSAVGAAQAAPNWTVYRDVKFGVTEEEKADLYLLNRGVNPVVVMIHGGGWESGDKSYFSDHLARMYASAGFHVAAINYRLAKLSDRSTQWNAQLQDVQLAVRWLRQYAAALRIDPWRIGAMGESAGAHLAVFLGSRATPASGDRSNLYYWQPQRVQAVVDVFGPVDLTQPDTYPQLAKLAVFGARSYAQVPWLYRNASPIFSVTSASARACIVHGTSDALIPFSQSAIFAWRLYALGVPYKWYSFNGGHAYAGLTTLQRQALETQALQCISGYLHPNPWNAL